jgi:adenine-specific DNA-methyltransferase
VETGGRAGAKIDFRTTGEVKLLRRSRPEGGLMEWEILREAPSGWPATAQSALKTFWTARITRQREIDASIAAKAEFEFLYDKPFSDSGKTRVAGPFTVASPSPHRTLAVDWDDELIDTFEAAEGRRKAERGDTSPTSPI